jgi:hypothetical protein
MLADGSATFGGEQSRFPARWNVEVWIDEVATDEGIISRTVRAVATVPVAADRAPRRLAAEFRRGSGRFNGSPASATGRSLVCLRKEPRSA